MVGTKSETGISYAPNCEIITIGSELLLGQIVDTNTTYLAQELGRMGVTVLFRTAVGDRLEEIEKVLLGALSRCDLAITTGGLGPTLDDLTREAVAKVAGVNLEFRQELMDEIEEMFRRYGFHMPENNRRQAFVPAGSKAIHNPVGTAPGFIKEIDGKPIVCLPGVPSELKYLLGREVIPWIQQRFGLSKHKILYRVLKTVGLGESKVDTLIGDLIKPGQNPEVGLLASMGEITIRIAARGEEEEAALRLIEPVAKEIRIRLGRDIFGENEDTLEGMIDSLLGRQGRTLAVVESFSGGLAANRLHAVPSSWLVESRVIPDRQNFGRWLGKQIGSLNEDFSMEASQKIRDESQAALGLAILGFAERRDKEYSLEGIVAVTGEGVKKCYSWQMGGDLHRLQLRGSIIGLNTLRLALLETFRDR